MAEDQWDDEEWLDDEYTDDEYDAAATFLGTEGFPGYIPATTDPGPWVFVLVAAYSLLMIVVLPALVIWGRKYEERRKAERAALEEEEGYEDDEGGNRGGDAEAGPATPRTQAETPDSQSGGRERLNRAPHGIDGRTGSGAARSADEFFDEQGHATSFDGDGRVEGIEVDHSRSTRRTVAMATPPPKKSGSLRSNLSPDDSSGAHKAHPVTATASKPGPKSAVSGAGTAVSGATVLSGLSRMNRAVEGAFDKVLIPTYPDDDAEIRSYLSGAQRTRSPHGTARSEAAVSAATTSRMQRHRDRGGRSENGAASETFGRGGTSGTGLHGRSPRILDAAGRPGTGGGRRGGRRRAARRGIGRAGLIARAVADEERSEMSRSDAGWIQRERILADGGGGGQVGVAGRSDLQSGTGASPSELRRRRDGGGPSPRGVSDAASSVLTADEPESGMRAWAQAGRRRLGMGGSGSRSAVSGYARSAVSAAASETPSVWKTQPFVDDITPNDAADADDPGQAKPYRDDDEAEVTVCCGPMALWRPKTLQYGMDYLIELAEPDAETKRIVRLGIPFTVSEVAEAFFEAVTVAVISQFLGTNEIAAYVVVQLLVGMTDELVNGITAAESTVCSHAVGSGQNHLAGQYVQISVVVYVLFSTPLLLMWSFIMDDVIKVLGLSDEIARIALEYTRVCVFHYLMEGVHSSYSVLLDITDHEMFGMWLEIAEGIVDVVVITAVCATHPDTNLVTVGFIHLIIAVFFFVLTLGVALYKGWLSAFWGGMLGSFALKNKAAVKNILATALPLALGSFLEYGEWEMLTFFIAYLGPAEVATWGILGAIWELFEASTEGLGEAAAVRVAYHLGKGNPIMARVSAYKSMLLSFLLSLFITSIFFMCGQNLATWFTSDPTLQHMLNDLIPLVGFGNVTMTVGMVCWSLVGAQGRYRLSTLVVLLSSWLVTLPLASLFIFGLTITLEGVVGAVVMGYSTAGMVLSYILLRSDWARLSKIIQELNAMTGEIESSDSESDDESESSSSSSSSSSDDDSSDSSSNSSNDSSDPKSEIDSATVGSRLSRRNRIS